VKFDLDPTITRVILIALLEFLIAVLGPTLVILQSGKWPSLIQFATILIVATIALCVYFVTFLKGESET